MASPRKTTAEPAAEAAPKKETGPVTKFPELVDAIVERTGEKRSTVKPVLEAFLESVKEKLGEGHDLTLPPLGKLRMVKQKDDGGPMTLKLRPQNAGKSSKTDLAEDDD